MTDERKVTGVCVDIPEIIANAKRFKAFAGRYDNVSKEDVLKELEAKLRRQADMISLQLSVHAICEEGT